MLRPDHPHRRRRSRLLSCVLFVKEGDQGQVSVSSSNEKEAFESEEDLELEDSDGIGHQLIPLSPVSCCFKMDNTVLRPTVSELDLSDSKVLLDLVDATDTSGSAVSFPDMAQGSFEADMLSHGTLTAPGIHNDSNILAVPISVSLSEEQHQQPNHRQHGEFDGWAMSTFLKGPCAQPRRDNVMTACSGGGVVSEGIAVETGSILQITSDLSGDCTFRSMIADEEKKRRKEEEEEDKEEEAGRQSVIPWMCYKTLRSDFDILKFTAAYHAAISLSAEYEKLSQRYQQQRLLPSNRDQPPDKVVKVQLNALNLQLGGLLEQNQPRGDEWLLQCGGTHRDLPECVPEGSNNGSAAIESSGPMVDDETDNLFGKSVLGVGSSCDTGEGGVVGVEDDTCSQHPYENHRLFKSHRHPRDPYPPVIPKPVEHPKKPSYILDAEGQKQSLTSTGPLPHPSTWTFQLGSHFTPVVNNTLTVTCENCLRQFKMSAPDRLDVLDRHQAEYCRTLKQQKWQRWFLVVEKLSGHGVVGRKHWRMVRKRCLRGVYQLLSRSINWTMDILVELSQFVQALLVDERSLGRNAGRFVAEEEEDGVVSSVLQGCESWYSPLRSHDPQEEEEDDVFFDAVESMDCYDDDDNGDEEMDEVELYRWL